MSAELSDKERIFITIINRLSSTAICCRRVDPFDENSFKDKDGRVEYVHFAYYRKPVAGDLVLGKTGLMRGAHAYSIGFYVAPLPDNMGGAVIREIGSQRLCNYSNEDFVPIIGLHKSLFLEGEEYNMSIKVQKAFSKGGEYMYRYGGCDFDRNQVTIWIREAFGGLKGESTPFSVKMDFDKKTTVKTILKNMKDGGYGTKLFEVKEESK